MVISFSVEEARNQLLEKGVVYTYRWHRRAFFRKDKGEIEDTWANSGRGTKKIADVKIAEIGQMDYGPEKLEQYLDKSGFNKLWEWQGRIMNMGIPGLENGWLYKVTLS